jgi:hypothetical protein
MGGPEPIRWGSIEAACEYERKLTFITVALLGLREAASWLRDEDLSRRVSGAVGRCHDLLRAVQKVTEK